MAPVWQVLLHSPAGMGQPCPARAWGLEGERGRGWAGGSLLDDGGQLCAEVLTVEPLLKQDVRSVPYVVPARAKDRQTQLPSVAASALPPTDLTLPVKSALAGPAELAACFPLAPPVGQCSLTHNQLSQKHRVPPGWEGC